MQLRPSQRGFTLIELMIALVVGLIVSAAAVALVAAIGKSNADTVRATRLTQELRATTEVIARDMRRARSDSDPIGNLSSNASVKATACNTVAPATSVAVTCATYAYNCSVTNGVTAGSFNAVGLVGGKVYLKQSPTGTPACPTATDIQISSSAVNVTGLAFKNYGSYIAISMSGHLAYQPSVTNSVTITNPTRSITQNVFIRSAAVP